MNILHYMILLYIILLPYHLDSLYTLQEPEDTIILGGECADKAFAYYSIVHNVSFCVGIIEGDNIYGSHAWCMDDNNNIIECAGIYPMDVTYTPYFILYPDGTYSGTFNQYTDKFI